MKIRKPMSVFTLLATLGTACGTSERFTDRTIVVTRTEVDDRSAYHDPVLSLYVQFIADEGAQRGKAVDARRVEIVFGDTNLVGGEVGLCFYEKKVDSDAILRGVKIIINPKFWDASSETTKMNLMRHEEGHCVLLKGHDNNNFNIMNSWLLRDEQTTQAIIDEFYR